jgi:pimeloyl-ACP methyl ester carboxylesterase
LASGLSLSYGEQGTSSSASSTLVLLPGPTDSWRSFAPLLAQLPASVHVFAVSPRGHGDSDKPEAGYAVEDMAEDVGAFLDAVGISRVVVAGHSGAGLVARRFALDHPARVAGLVLLAAPTTLRGHDGLQAFASSILSGLADPIDPALARSLVADTSGPQLPASFADDMVEEILKAPARVWHQTFGGVLSYDDVEELDRIEAPTLLVWGDADDVVSREMQDALVSRLAAAELVVYAGLGHSPHWEDPVRVASDVAAFVERVGALPG